MEILSDGKIPGVARALAPAGRVRTFVGPRPPAGDLARARVLVVRSVTRVDAALLREAPHLSMVASATAGTDHVDRRALAAHGVAFAHAPGANAAAVAEYVVAAMLAFGPTPGAKVAVVGFGQTGRRVTVALRRLGYEVAVSDPPLARRRAVARGGAGDPLGCLGRVEDLQPLARTLDGAAALTLHVPRTEGGPHPTVGLVEARALAHLAPASLVVNTSRGEVLDLSALARSDHACVLDVWPGEPAVDPRWLARLGPRLRLATPHVAGYSREAKVRATEMVRRAVLEHLGVPGSWTPSEAPPERLRFGLGQDPPTWLLDVMGLLALDGALRRALVGPARARGQAFESLRRVQRREFAHLSPAGLPSEARAFLARVRHLVPR